MRIEELWLVDDDFLNEYFSEYEKLINSDLKDIKWQNKLVYIFSADQALNKPEFEKLFGLVREHYWKERSFSTEDNFSAKVPLTHGVSFAARFSSELGHAHTFLFKTKEDFASLSQRYEEMFKCRYSCDVMLAVKAESEKEFWLLSRFYLFTIEKFPEGSDNVQAIDFIRMQWST